MKAYVLNDIGKFQMKEVEKPVPDKGEVLVEVRAAGICGSDIPRIYTTGTYSYPLIPGHEFSGVVVDSGSTKRFVSSSVGNSGADGAGFMSCADWRGRRVGIFPLIPCMECAACRIKRYEMCSHYSYLGSRTDGGFAEYVRVPEWNLIELPENVSLKQAAMLEPMSVAVHAIRRAGLGSAESGNSGSAESGNSEGMGNDGRDRTIGICGLGTIGLFIAMFLKEMGYRRIFCIGNKDFQREQVAKLVSGAAETVVMEYCDTGAEDPVAWIKERTDGQGVDVFFECVGKNQTVVTAIESTAIGGTIQLVGNPASDMRLDKAIYWKILRRQLSVLGTWNSSFTHSEDDDWHYVLGKLESGAIHPEQVVTHRFPFDALMQGFELMRDKTEDYIKVMGVFV